MEYLFANSENVTKNPKIWIFYYRKRLLQSACFSHAYT